MKTLLLTCVLMLLVSSPCWSQQVVSIDRLRGQIQRLEAIDRNPTISAKRKDNNRSLLQNQRAQLHISLKKRIIVLREYKSNIRSESEKQVVEDSISELKTEVRKLEKDMKRDSSWLRCRELPEPR